MLLPTVPFYSLAYQVSPPVLRGQTHRTLTPAEFTEVCELLLLACRHHQCRYWLLDSRADIGYRPADLHQWLLYDYLPRVRAALGSTPIMAFIANSVFWTRLDARGYMPPSTEPRKFFQTGWFAEEAPALEWLDQFRWL